MGSSPAFGQKRPEAGLDPPLISPPFPSALLPPFSSLAIAFQGRNALVHGGTPPERGKKTEAAEQKETAPPIQNEDAEAEEKLQKTKPATSYRLKDQGLI